MAVNSNMCPSEEEHSSIHKFHSKHNNEQQQKKKSCTLSISIRREIHYEVRQVFFWQKWCYYTIQHKVGNHFPRYYCTVVVPYCFWRSTIRIEARSIYTAADCTFSVRTLSEMSRSVTPFSQYLHKWGMQERILLYTSGTVTLFYLGTNLSTCT